MQRLRVDLDVAQETFGDRVGVFRHHIRLSHRRGPENIAPKMARAAGKASGPGSEKRSCLDGFLQFLRRPEGDLLSRLDLDRLPGCRGTAPAGRALSGPPNAPTPPTNTAPPLLMLLH